MRKTFLVLVIAALAMAGCGGDSGDEAAEDIPAPGATSPTTAAAATGMAGQHAEHGGGAAAGGGASSDCSPSGTTSVVAQNTAFNTACLAAPAGRQFTLSYENKDPIGHNIVFLESHTATEVMFRADIFTGPKTNTFSVGPFQAGTYAFHCEVHPSVMKGTFVVK